ncbi:uncharacterized protein VP01_901g3 [Puccinia sorghi]|uniref:Uncharacterized protein n=1 Tax=Puccinia sorghi TaxID=27349 RepID=A0A0L6U7S8_9BASI|nr:uncharacterized protein VP01_901g3 [Puccinia sorghi]
MLLCKANVNNTGWIIQDCLEKEDHELFWLPRVKGWLKCDLVNINNEDLYCKWIDAAVKAKKSESGMRLTLQMTNLTDTAKLSHQDDLLDKRVAYQEALKESKLLRRKYGEERNGEVEEAELDPNEWNNCNFHM